MWCVWFCHVGRSYCIHIFGLTNGFIVYFSGNQRFSENTICNAHIKMLPNCSNSSLVFKTWNSLDSSSSVCSSDSVKKQKSSDLSTPLYQRSALDDLYTVSDKAKFVQNQGETIAYKKDSNTQIYESAKCKRKSMMVKSK